MIKYYLIFFILKVAKISFCFEFIIPGYAIVKHETWPGFGPGDG